MGLLRLSLSAARGHGHLDEGTRNHFKTSNSVKAAKCVCMPGLKGEAALGQLKGEVNIKVRKNDEEGNGRVY